MKLFNDRPIREAVTPDEMRRAIHEYSYYDSLTRNAMNAADANGFSGEDRYTLLAYHALQQKHALMDQLIKLHALTPSRPLLLEPK